MNMTRLFTMVLAAACLLACMPIVSASGDQGNTIAPCSEKHAISIDQAKDNVRAFTGDNSLEPTTISIANSVVGCHYILDAKNTTFMVNADTGVVELIHFRDNIPASSQEIRISRDEAYAKVQEYANQKSDNFSKKTWALVVDRMAGPADGPRGYVFAFREEIRSGDKTVLLPNIVIAGVNPETGAIISYAAINRLPINGGTMTQEQQAFNDYLDHLDEYITGP
jgi:hypothetical protein